MIKKIKIGMSWVEFGVTYTIISQDRSYYEYSNSEDSYVGKAHKSEILMLLNAA